jgi:hypothetical protein
LVRFGGRPTTSTPPVFRETSVVGPGRANHRTPPKGPPTTRRLCFSAGSRVVVGSFGGVQWLVPAGPTTEVSLKTGGVLVVGRPPWPFKYEGSVVGPGRTNHQGLPASAKSPGRSNAKAKSHVFSNTRVWWLVPAGPTTRDCQPVQSRLACITVL